MKRSKISFSILSIFPQAINNYFNYGIMHRAIENNIIDLEFINIRDFSKDKHFHVDDSPYGGGAGMLMQVQPIYDAWKSVKKRSKTLTVLLSAKGKVWDQQLAQTWSKKYNKIILISGRYEGVDERVKAFVNEELRIGDYVLSGGELASAIVVDSISRLLPGVLGSADSLLLESHTKKNYLEYPQYTKPIKIKIKNKIYSVPEVLLSGNHKKIEEWRKKNSKINK